MVRLWIALPLIFLSGCAMFSKAREENLREIHPGLKKDEVVSILGKPDKELTDHGIQKWQYTIVSSDLKHEYPYVANFSDDGVLTDFYQNSGHSDDAKPEAPARKGGGKHRGGG
jgi:outer membrane protein assembly factor BamE (lipoprotein component of BamABCDE complex)